MTIWYWAYGSNLSFRAMQRRCPGAIPYRSLSLPNRALVFRGVADVEIRDGSIVHGGLWKITKRHERSLDEYEGVKFGLYSKKYLGLRIKGEKVSCLYYKMMNERGIDAPSDAYIQCIVEGYQDFKLPLEDLEAALQHSWENKKPTRHLIERRRRRGGVQARSIFNG